MLVVEPGVEFCEFELDMTSILFVVALMVALVVLVVYVTRIT